MGQKGFKNLKSILRKLKIKWVTKYIIFWSDFIIKETNNETNKSMTKI